MRALHPLLALAILLFALPIGSRAASIQILSSARSVFTSAYVTDDVIELNDGEADSTFAVGPYSKTVASNLSFGPITCDASASQTSAFATSAFHSEGAHSCFAQDTGTFGFAVAAGSSSFHVVFRLLESSGYALSGFVEGFDLGFSTITFSGPGGTIFAHTASGQHFPFNGSGVLQAGDYDLNVTTYGSAHGWPPLPSYSSGAFEIHFALNSATDAPAITLENALQAFPNPFTSATRIRIPDGVRSVRVFDAAGRLVRVFEGSAFQDWDGRDENGTATPAGIYFVRAEDASGAAPLKLVRIR